MPPSAVLAQSTTTAGSRQRQIVAMRDKRDIFRANVARMPRSSDRYFSRLNGPMRATASAAFGRLRTIARRRFHLSSAKRPSAAKHSVSLPSEFNFLAIFKPGGEMLLNLRSLPWRWFRGLADDASSPRSICERSIRVGRPRPGAVRFQLRYSFAARRGVRRKNRPDQMRARATIMLRARGEPTDLRISFPVLGQSNWAVKRHAHCITRIIQTAIENKAIPAAPHGPGITEQMQPNDRRFLPIAR